MERWQNKIAVITGASSGIGAATAKVLVSAGLIVAGLARRVDRVEALRNELPENLRDRLNPIKCDVSNEKEVIETFASIAKKFGGTDVLVNNAGIMRQMDLVTEDNGDDLRAVIDTNVMGVTYCTREAFKSMKSRNVDGHVIFVNSVYGHCLPMTPGSPNIYAASKHALTAMTEIYRREFFAQNTKVKVSSISPGLVATEILPEGLDKVWACLKAEDVADAIKYVLQTPPNVQIHELTIKPMGEQF